MASNAVPFNTNLVTEVGKLVQTLSKGYPLEIFKITLDDKFKCVICTYVLRDPMQSYCSHRMCKCCLQYLKSTKGIQIMCPGCEKEDLNEYSNLSQVFPDRALHREMMKFEIICEFSPECSWTGKLKDYKKHLDICEFQVLDCVFGCGTKIKGSEAESHNKDFLTKHIELLFIKVTDVEKDFAQRPGASANNTDMATIDAKVNSLAELLNNLQVGATRLENEVAERQLSQSTMPVSQSTFDPTHPEVDQMNLSLTTLQSSIDGLFNSLEERYTHLARIQSGNDSDQSAIDSLRQTASRLERSLQMKEVTLQQLENRIVSIESTSYTGTFVFRIPDWSRKQREAANGTYPSIYSPPFYTSRSGYKLCLRLYPNGDGMGRGTHISLFFVVMRGPHDSILKWPFRQKVTFSLLDQTGSDHVVESFRPDPTSSSFRKPVSDMNIASGCPLFVPLPKLTGRSKYVSDDILFVRVVVDQSDI